MFYCTGLVEAIYVEVKRLVEGNTHYYPFSAVLSSIMTQRTEAWLEWHL
jgi:hypothetical protein